MQVMNALATNRGPQDFVIDAEVGNRLIEVKIGVAGLRNVRLGLMQLAYALTERPHSEGYMLLSDVEVTWERLETEWQKAAAVLRKEPLARMVLCVEAKGEIRGIPRTPDPVTQRILLDVLEVQRGKHRPRQVKADASFVVLKVLLHHWLTNGEFVTANWLARTAGYSYPTVANVLGRLGSLIERGPKRRLRLRWFPHEEWVRLISLSDQARSTVRFADRSGQPRAPEDHLARLEKINPKEVAIGGVLGAKHYFPDLDIVGTPRLDLSVWSGDIRTNFDLIRMLDPALQCVQDPREPASVVVHTIYHADPLFEPRAWGLHWADPVECMLDLHDARLDLLAGQFLEALQQRRPRIS